jgi:hypothetical protein
VDFTPGGGGPIREVMLVLEVDGEGVVRVTGFDGKKLSLNQGELGQLLTGLLKAVCAVHPDRDETIEVLLN